MGEKTPVKIPLYLKVAGLHPWHQPVNETSYVLTFDAVGVIFQVVDDVGANSDLLLGVRGGQIRVELIESSHIGMVVWSVGEL